MDKLKEITKCEVCNNETLTPILNLGLHPMCDDLIKVEDSRTNEEYPIEILYCDKCYTAHQKYQIPKQQLFPSDYHYRARFTKDVLDGMKQLVNDIELKFGSLEGKKVLDIGCNDGSLLDFFQAKGAITFGIEPTNAHYDASQKGHYIINSYFDKDVAKNHIKPDVITFTNVFAHIEDLNGLIDNLKILIKENTLLVIENHYLGAVIEKNQFDTFYHEHPRTYSLNSFYYIAKKLGLNIIAAEFPSRYGGNIRITMGKNENLTTSTNDIDEVLIKESQFYLGLEKMNLDIIEWKKNKLEEIQTAINKYGLLEAKAFPGRSAIPVKMLGLNENHIKCVYEKPKSLKIGYKVPGTNIPIVSDDDLGDLNKKPVILNLAWHIATEIEKYLREKGFTGQLINII
jgi:SAM-dependent methyltransferase